MENKIKHQINFAKSIRIKDIVNGTLAHRLKSFEYLVESHHFQLISFDCLTVVRANHHLDCLYHPLWHHHLVQAIAFLSLQFQPNTIRFQSIYSRRPLYAAQLLSGISRFQIVKIDMK